MPSEAEMRQSRCGPLLPPSCRRRQVARTAAASRGTVRVPDSRHCPCRRHARASRPHELLAQNHALVLCSSRKLSRSDAAAAHATASAPIMNRHGRESATDSAHAAAAIDGIRRNLRAASYTLGGNGSHGQTLPFLWAGCIAFHRIFHC